MKKIVLIAAAGMVLGCSNQQVNGDQSSEVKNTVGVATQTTAQRDYDRSVECFIYGGLNNMDQQVTGEFTGNKIVPMLIADATTRGAALGKSADAVKADLQTAVEEGAARVEAMKQPEREAYVKKSVDEAITCLRDLRNRMAAK